MRFAAAERIKVSDSFDIPAFGAPNAIGSASSRFNASGRETPQPIQAPPGVESNEFTNSLTSTPGLNNAMRSGFQQMAITSKTNKEISEMYRDAMEESEEKFASAKRTGDIFRFAGKVVGTALPLAFCDMRVKHDVAELSLAEVSDELAALAFTVKALRECS